MKNRTKGFLSYTYPQVINYLWRLARQIEDKYEERLSRLEELKDNLHLLSRHEDQLIKELSSILLERFPISKETLAYWIQKLEVMGKMNLKDEDFLIHYNDLPKIKKTTFPIHLILDNIRSSFNVGSILRTAETFGVETVHLCGQTPKPDSAKTAKSSMGTENWIHWQSWNESLECIDKLKEDGYCLIGLETTSESINLNKVTIPSKLALVFGNERYGLSPVVLKRCNYICSIKNFGRKNSLNVGVCAGIALQESLNQFFLKN